MRVQSAVKVLQGRGMKQAAFLLVVFICGFSLGFSFNGYYNSNPPKPELGWSYTVTRRQVFEDNFGLLPHECGWRVWQYPEYNNTIFGFWVRVNSNINWLSEDGGIWVSSHHQGYTLFSKTYADAPVHFATDWVLAKTEPFPKSIHLKDGSLSIDVLNANTHPVAVSLKLIEEEVVFGKIE